MSIKIFHLHVRSDATTCPLHPQRLQCCLERDQGRNKRWRDRRISHGYSPKCVEPLKATTTTRQEGIYKQKRRPKHTNFSPGRSVISPDSIYPSRRFLSVYPATMSTEQSSQQLIPLAATASHIQAAHPGNTMSTGDYKYPSQVLLYCLLHRTDPESLPNGS
jgi:hypothetical protein